MFINSSTLTVVASNTTVSITYSASSSGPTGGDLSAITYLPMASACRFDEHNKGVEIVFSTGLDIDRMSLQLGHHSSLGSTTVQI